jgi:hypothetical protein
VHGDVSFVNACPKKWLDWPPLAEYWYNTRYHSSNGRTSFEALYGHPRQYFGIPAGTESAITNMSQWLQDHQIMTYLIKQHLNRATMCMKSQANKHRSKHQFQICDLVLLKLQPYVQSSLAPRANKKLAFKYFNSFAVLQRIDKVAYKLDLHNSSSLHPVLYVS